MTTTDVPETSGLGARAAEILTLIKNTREYARLVASSQAYSSCWATFTGYPLIANWNLTTDTPALFEEALRVLALKSAVFELTGGDEELAELEISAPVDAGWGEPNRRYWLDRAEMGRRLDILGATYESIGIEAEGRSHRFTFEEPTPAESVAAGFAV